MVKTEDLTQGEMYRIHYLSPFYPDDDDDDDDDDTTMIFHLDTYEGAFIYTSWPACPFDLDDVFRINTGVLRCMMMYRTNSDPRIICIYLYFYNTGTLVRCEYIL